MREPKELGMVVTQFDTPYDAALQSRQIDDAIARQFDALAIRWLTSQKRGDSGAESCQEVSA